MESLNECELVSEHHQNHQNPGEGGLMSIPFAQQHLLAGNRHREPQESEEEGSYGHANPSRLTSVCAEADGQS